MKGASAEVAILSFFTKHDPFFHPAMCYFCTFFSTFLDPQRDTLTYSALMMATKTREYVDVQTVGITFTLRTSAPKIKMIPNLLLHRPQAPGCCIFTLL